MHTPGPWQVSPIQEEEHILLIEAQHEFHGWLAISGVFCNDMFLSEEEEQANANLIAAAPELLEACEIALDALGCDRVRVDRLEAQEIIHRAINKAKGG